MLQIANNTDAEFIVDQDMKVTGTISGNVKLIKGSTLILTGTIYGNVTICDDCLLIVENGSVRGIIYNAVNTIFKRTA